MTELEVKEKKEKVHKDKSAKKEKKSKKRKAEEATEENGSSDIVVKKKKKKKDIISDEGSNGLSSPEKTPSKTVTVNGHSVEVPERRRTRSVSLSEEQDPIAQKGRFSNFDISDTTVEKLKAAGVNYLFPVQAETFDMVYGGKDVVAQARTGTGKTFAFAIPLVEKLKDQIRQQGRAPKALVMAPTRELAKQVCDNFKKISQGIDCMAVYGGTPYDKQERQLRYGVDVVVGTPGRILDFAKKGTLKLSTLQHMVLDEVDRMLDMGFAEIVDDILQFAYTKDRVKQPQTLLFSATLPNWVHDTAKKYMSPDVEKIDLVGRDIVKTSTTVQHLAIKCGYHDRASTLGDILQVYSGNHGRAMVFCETKRDADELAVSTAIKQETHVLHGDIPQEKREMVLQGFREGKYKVLITTDVAARGLDIPEVDLVIQCNPPKDVDSYIHRSGRTGRAGRTGTCVCFYKPREDWQLKTVENRAGITFKRIGAPTTEDIVKAAANDAVRSLDTISPDLLNSFTEAAEKMIEERGAVTALAAALAVISGSTELKSRSLLNARQGYTTYHFTTNIVMEGKGYAFKALRRWLPEEIMDKVSTMRFTKDKMGTVFDLPSDLNSSIENRWQDGKFDSLVKATELPECEEEEAGGWGGYGGGGGRGFGRGGGRGFGGGGRGFGGGGRGRFGGGRGNNRRGGSRGGFGGQRNSWR